MSLGALAFPQGHAVPDPSPKQKSRPVASQPFHAAMRDDAVSPSALNPPPT
jgi:hypothetical protein